MIITLSRNELAAACLFASKDESRYIITGVAVQVAAGTVPLLVATDGKRLCAIATVAEQRQGFGESFTLILRPDWAKALVAMSKALGGKLMAWIAFDIQPGAKPMTVEFVGTNASLAVADSAAALIAGEYPNWRKVMPAKKAARAAITDMALNAEYIGDFAKAAKLMGSDTAQVQMNLVGKEQQVEVALARLPNFYGLVMQCRLDDNTEYQPEFTQIVEQLPPPPAETDPEDVTVEEGGAE